MFRWLLLFFIVTPIVEMYLLLTVGGYIGALWTIGLVMLTAVIGVSLLRRQGLSTLLRGQERLAAGQLPADEIAEGLLLAVAGPLLLTPGFVTDGMDFLLLWPAVRRFLAHRLSLNVRVLGPNGPGHGAGGANGPFGSQRPTPGSAPDVIEGEFERRDSDSQR